MTDNILLWEFTRFVSNLIGGTLRWLYGSIWRTLFNKNKFTYKEYLFGPNKSKKHFDIHGHQFNNRIICFLFIGVLAYLIT